MVTPAGDDEEEKRDVDQEVKFLKEIFPNFDEQIIQKALKEQGQFDKTFKHLQEFYEQVTLSQIMVKD